MSDTLIPVEILDHLARVLISTDTFVKFEDVTDMMNVFLITVFYPKDAADEESDSQERYYVATMNGIIEV